MEKTEGVYWQRDKRRPIFSEETLELAATIQEHITTNHHDVNWPTVPAKTQMIIINIMVEALSVYGKAAIEVDGNYVIIFTDTHGGFGYVFVMNNEVMYVDDKDGGYLRDDVKIVFLGDFVGRGPESLRLLMHFYTLKILRWDQIYMVRGNHEDYTINGRDGFFAECAAKFKEPERSEVWRGHNLVFRRLPAIAKICGKIYGMHGGIPSQKFIFRKLLRTHAFRLNDDFKALLEELTWNDPNHGYDDSPDFKRNTDRNTGHEFQDRVVVPFCKEHGVELIVRGHEAYSYGFHIFKQRQPLFSLFSPANYDNSGSIGAILKVIKRPDGTLELVLLQFDPLVPKKPMSTEKTVAMAVVGAAAVAGIVAGASFVKGKSSIGPSQAVRESFAQNSMILSRVVNAVSISASSPGAFDENQLINELFPYGNHTDLRALRGMKSLEWSNDYDAISNLIGSECTGDNGCGVHKKMLDDIEKVVKLEVNPQNLKTMNPGSKMAGDEIKALLDTLIQNNKAELILRAIAITTAPASEVSELDWMLAIGKAEAPLDKPQDYIKQLQKMSSLLTIKGEFDGYVKILQVISPLISVQQFNVDLKTAQAKYQKLMSVVTRDFIKNLESKLEKLAEMDPALNENKLVTAGFYNGFEDFKKVLKDDENDWLKEVLNLGKDLKELKAKLTPLKDTVQKLEPLNKVWKDVNFDSAQKSIYNMQSLVRNLDVLSDVSTTLSTVQTCLKDVKTDQKFNIDSADWIRTLQSSASQLIPLKSSIDAFASDESVNQLSKLSALRKTHEKKREELKTEVQKLTDLPPVTENLKKLQKALQSVDVKVVEESFKIIKEINSTVIVPFKTWSENLDFSAISTCLKGQSFKDNLEKLNPNLQALVNNKPTEDQLKSVRKMTEELKKLGMEVAKIKVKSPKKDRRRRRANEEFVLENHQIKARVLGKINSAVQKLIKLKAMEDDVKTLIKGKTQIDAVIQKESDPNVRKVLDELWNENTVKNLEGILNAADKLDEEIKKKKEIKMIKDFSDPYNAATEAPVSKVDIKKLAMILDGKIQDAKLTASLNKLKSLDLKFSKHGNVIQNTLDIHKYFRSVFGIDDDCIDGSCEKGTDYTGYIIGGVLVGCCVLGGVVGFFLYKRFKKVPEKSKSDPIIVPVNPDPEEKKPDGQKEQKKLEEKITEDDLKKEDAELSKKFEENFKNSAKKKVPVDRREEYNMKVYPIGNGVNVVVDKDEKISVVPAATCIRDCSAADSGRAKTMKELRKKEKEMTENKDNVEDEQKVKIPGNLKKFEEDIKNKAAKVKEDDMYNLKICIPNESGGKIKVSPWTREVHKKKHPPPPIVPSNRPAYNQEALLRGEYVPYVIRYPIGKGNEDVKDPRVDPDHTDPTQSTLDESTRQLKTASSTTKSLATVASNTATAVQQLTPALIAIKEMEEFMKKN